MQGPRDDRNQDADVVCIACGTAVTRADAREYDKFGNRWDRRDKEFEYFCSDCHDEMNHQPRNGLEALLVESGAGTADRETFLTQYTRLSEKESDRVEER